MQTLKAMFFLLLTFAGTFSVTLHAQHDAFDGNIDFVAGPDYKVVNEASGYVVYWQDLPADEAQLDRGVEGEVTVYTPDGEEKLVILLDQAGRFTEVIDLEYSSRADYLQRNDNETDRSMEPQDFDWNAPREVRFENGLRIRYANGAATATYRGETLTVTGDEGRYRVATDTFEAGMAFGPSYGKQVYRYFKSIQ